MVRTMEEALNDSWQVPTCPTCPTKTAGDSGKISYATWQRDTGECKLETLGLLKSNGTNGGHKKAAPLVGVAS